MTKLGKLALAAFLAVSGPAVAQGVFSGGIPFAFTPLTPGQHNLAITGSTGLTIPAAAQYAVVCAQTALVHYTTDGTTAPTATVGNLIPVNTCVNLAGPTVLANFRALSATGTLDVEYFR